MIQLLRIHALVRTASVLLFIASAADYVRKAACQKAEAIAIEATAWCNARDAAWRQVKNDQAPVDEQRRLPVLGLHCCAISLSGANPHGVVDIRDENLAITN